ncbi:MAG: hypothetical protein IKP10_05665 [Clostridia bacterium]|nr:hypothetical protein [Clostridia bacterium]
MRAEEKTMPNRRENALMMDLMMVRNTIYKNADAVRERLRPFRNGWRDLRLLMTLVNKTQDRLILTMPDKRVAYYDKLASYAQVIIDIPGPVPRGRHILVTDEHLAAVCEAAMKGECALCARTGREAQRCRIREALLEAAPPETVSGPRTLRLDCEYQEAANALLRGEEVTV